MDFRAACGPLLRVSIAILINPDIIEFLFHNKKSDIISNHLSQVYKSTVTALMALSGATLSPGKLAKTGFCSALGSALRPKCPGTVVMVTMKYVLGYFRMFIVCPIVHNDSLQ